MKTIVPDSLAPGLTDKQLECLYILRDGNWHDRNEIRREIRNYIPANISGRIIRPLEKRGIVEQKKEPVKAESKKIKMLVRIRKDFDEHILHLLIEYSANDLALKYSRKKNSERANFFLTIRDESIRKLVELGNLEEKRQQKEEEEFWNKRLSLEGSEQWKELTRSHKRVYDVLKPGCKKCCEAHGIQEKDCFPLKIPGVSFLIATSLNQKLWAEIMQQERNEAISKGQVFDSKQRRGIHYF